MYIYYKLFVGKNINCREQQPVNHMVNRSQSAIHTVIAASF